MKKILALLCTLVLLVGLCPANFVTAEEAPQYLTKTAAWTGSPTSDKDKTNLDIVLEAQDISQKVKGKILFLGSLCNAHTLTADTVKSSLETAAQYTDVDIRLWQMGNSLEVGTKVEGTMKKGQNLKKTADANTNTDIRDALNAENSLQKSQHSILYKIAETLTKDVNPSDYAMIVMEFDGMRMGMFNSTATADNKKLLGKAADVLKDLYAAGKVVWIIPPKNAAIEDAYDDKGKTYGYTGTGSKYMYNDVYFDTAYNYSSYQNNVKNTMMLLAPEDMTYNKSTGAITFPSGNLYDNGTYPIFKSRVATSDDQIWVEYGNNTAVQNFLNKKFTGIFYEKIVIEDTVADAFTIKSVTGYYNDGKAEKVVKSDTSPKFTYVQSGQKVTGTFITTGADTTNVKMVISCEVKTDGGDPFLKDGVEKTDNTYKLPTNKGDAKLDYYSKEADSTPKVSSTAASPKIEKNYYTVTAKVIDGKIAIDGGTKDATEKKVTVPGGTDVTVSYEANENYKLDSIKIDSSAAATTGITSSKKFEKINADHEIEVKYVPITYKVDFDLNGVEISNTEDTKEQTVLKNDKATEPENDPAPTDTDIEFEGWYDSDKYETEFDFDTPITKDTTVYGKFTVPVIYHDPTGPNTDDDGKTVIYNEKVGPYATDPSCTGYEFGGYFTDEDCTEGNEFNFDTPITDKTDIYLKWTEKTATLTYDKNAGDDNEKVTNLPDPETLKYTETHTISGKEPARPGYSFEGWGEESDSAAAKYGKNDLYKEKDVEPEDDTVYALWKENDVTITYLADEGGTLTQGAVTGKTYFDDTIKAANGTPTGAVAVPSTGHDFVGWTIKDVAEKITENTEFVPGPDDDGVKDGVYQTITYVAHFTKHPYTVTFDFQGHGTKTDDYKNQKVDYQDTATDPAADDEGKLPSETGYEFGGWYLDKACTKPYDFATPVEMDTTLYAKWTTEVTFHNTQGPVTDNTIVEDVLVGDKTSALDPAPSATGYTTDGKYYADNKFENEFDFDDEITEPTDIYLKWTENSAPLHYDKNTTDTVTGMPDPNPETMTYTQAHSLSSATPARTGYDFLGWAESKSATDKDYAPSASYKAANVDPVEDTLYAVWKEKEAKLTYHANTGDAETDKTVIDMPETNPETLKYTLAHSVSSATPEREGYIFKGWATTKEKANAGTVEYDPADPYKDANVIPVDGDLYAVWEEITATLHYEPNANGEKVKNLPADETMGYEEEHHLSTETPKRKGYNFLGWADEATDTTTDYKKGDKIKDEKTVPEDKTVYALWAEKNKPLTYHENADDEPVTGMPDPNPETMYYTKQHNVSKAKPEREGYIFKGWATTEVLADAGTVEYARKALYKEENVVPVKGDLYAVWKEIKAPLHYDPNTNDPTVANMPKDQKMTYTQALNLRKNVPTRLGYTFKGWAETPEGEVKYSPEDLYKDPNVIPVEATLYAVWEENTATFTYYSNEGGTVTVETETIGVVTGTPTGSEATPLISHNFFNWTDADGETVGTDPTFTPVKNEQGIYEDGEYYANFAIKKYDVAFDLMGHGNNDDGYYNDQVVDHGSKAEEPTPDPSEEGYKFIDWYEEPECENVYDFETPITESKTLYARWETVVTFIEPTGPYTDKESEDILVGDTTDKRNPSCKGYDFGGFFTDKEFTKPFDFDAPVTEPTTVYAKWIEHTGTLTYNLNGGTSQDKLDQGMRFTEKAEVRTLVPVREGHTFKGWATSKKNADAGKVEYTGKQLYKAAMTDPIDGTLYAVWEKNVVPFTGDIMNTTYTVVVMGIALFTGVLIYKKRVEDEGM